MKAIIICFLLLSAALLAEEVQLNLPKKFDVKVSKEWVTKNNKKINGNKIEEHRPRIFHFDGINFTYIDQKHTQYGQGDYIWGMASGTFKNGILKGKYKWKSIRYCYENKNLICLKTAYTRKLNGRANSEGLLHIVISSIKDHSVDYHYIRKRDKNGHLTNAWDDATLKTNKYNANSYQYKQHFLLQLPVGELQSSQTPIQDIPEEPKTIQEQSAVTPKIDLTTEAGVSIGKQTEETPQPKTNPCTPPIDDAWKEYCEAKAYNAKIKEEEEADAKAAEQEAKEEEAYQKRLDAWNEEERQSNISFIKSQEAERQKAREIWEKEDKASNDSIAKDQAERRAKQVEIEKAHKIIDRFGDDYETQRAAHKKVEALAKTADTQKAKRIKNAIRKQFYDSKQIKLQADAEYQTSKAKELGKKEKYLNTVKETSLTVNKVLARIDSEIDPLKIGNKIVDLQENSYDAIDSYSKGGLSKVADDFIEKKANELSNDWAGVAKEKAEEYKQYHSKKGLKLKPDEIYYDKNGKQLKKVNAYQKVYDKKGNEVSFSFGKRIFKKTFSKLNDDYNSIQGTAEHIKNIKEGVMSGDVNKVVNETLDMTEKEDEGDEKKDGAKKID